MAAMKLRERLAGKKVACVMSGGNIDQATLKRVLGTGQGSGRIRDSRDSIRDLGLGIRIRDQGFWNALAAPGKTRATASCQRLRPWRNIDLMTMPSVLGEIDRAVQELRSEQHQGPFTQKLGHVVTAFGAIPDSPPRGFTADAMVRLRELADETVEAIEQRLDSGGDGNKVQQKLAGTVYEVRKRMEAVEVWFKHYYPSLPSSNPYR